MNGSGMEDWQAREEQIAALLAAANGPLVVEVRLPGGADVYVQAIADEGDVLLEAVSNRYLSDEHRLSASAQSAMAALGWEPPTDDAPNYHQVRRDTELSSVAALLVHTLAWGYGARSTDEWSVAPPELAELLGGTSPGSPNGSLVGAWLWVDDQRRPFRALVTTSSEFWLVDLTLSGDALPDTAQFRDGLEAAARMYPGAFVAGPAEAKRVNQYRVVAIALGVGVRLRGSGALWLPTEQLGRLIGNAENPARVLLEAAGGRGSGHAWRMGEWAAETVEVVPDPSRAEALAAAVVPDDPARRRGLASLAHRLDPSLPPPPPTAASDPGVLQFRADGDPTGLTAHSVTLLNVDELASVASDERTPNDLLLDLRDHRDHSVRAAHAARLGLSEADVEKHCNDGATAVLRTIVLNASVTAMDRISALTRLGDDDAASAVAGSDLTFEDLMTGDVGLIGPQTELALLRRPGLTEEALLESPRRHAVLASSHVPAEWATRVLAGAPTLRELQALCERTDLDPDAVGVALRDAATAGSALQLGSALRSSYLPEGLMWQALAELFHHAEDLCEHDTARRLLAGPMLASVDKIRLHISHDPLLRRLDENDLTAIRSELQEGIALIDSLKGADRGISMASTRHDESRDAVLMDLERLAERAFEAERAAANAADEVVVRPSVPILYFGDAPAYLGSELRVITVGLNPSGHEFPAEDPFARFPGAQHGAGPEYLAALNAYFTTNPYSSWFNTFSTLLDGMGSGFRGGPSGTALHTDLCSPIATSPTWSSLDRAHRAELIESGRPLWHDLVFTLRPHIALISVADEHLANIEFPALSEWTDVHEAPGRTRPYVFRGRWVTIADHPTLLVRGLAWNKPFQPISDANKSIAGRVLHQIWEQGPPRT